MPHFIQSALQARQSDQKCIASGVPSLVLMEKAAMGIARFLEEHPSWQNIVFVCGPGNNGADGLAAARLLKENGARVLCLFDETGHVSPDEQVQYTAALSAGVPVVSPDTPRADEALSQADVIVDALFGSGLSRPLTGVFASLVACINRLHEQGKPVVSVDIASGLDGNTGEIPGCAVKADFTIALDSIKEGQIRRQGPAYSGTIHTCDIGIAEHFHTATFYVLDEMLAKSFMKKRPVSGHKGTFGKVLYCGGSLQMQGALNMAATAAFHAGCGTITLYTPRSAAKAIAAKNDLAMMIPAADINGFFDIEAVLPVSELAKTYTMFALGNGMGKGRGAMCLTEAWCKQDIPLLIDADGISCLARQKQLLERTSATIITPHPAEFARISGKDVQEILSDPIGCAREFCTRYPNVTLVLKGEQTIVASGEKMAWLHHPTSALAKGGSGDVLAGLITGLWAWHPDPFEAACLGVYVHNQAAFAQKDISPVCFTPLDLIAGFNPVFLALS